jgi:diguanylate cyclase (GGDEF)-like protein/PAS domain S-box-containing protein
MPNSKDELLYNAQILVVDDTLDSLKLLTKILRDAGYTVRPANTGELALASIGTAIPDMVLLDVLMPGMDGYAVCEQLKAKPDTCDIPVIFISALEKPMDKLRGFQAGAVDFITKPYVPSEVLARVSTHLKLHLLQKEFEHTNRKLIQEIEKRNIAESLLLLEKERFRITLLSIGDGVVTTDNAGYITLLNDVAKDLTGWAGESAVGKPFSEVFNIIDEDTREKCVVPIKEAIETGRIVGLANHTVLIAKNDMEIPITDSISPITDTEGCINGVVMVFQNVTNERAKQKEIEFMSYHDLLTGLYNRRFYEEELRRLDTNRNLPLTLVMGDVNGLKLINDSFGHAMGDELLKKIAEVIKRGCRADDIIARLGGDEFIILLPKTSTLEAEHIVERISDLSIKEKVCGIDISISFGYRTKTKEEEKIADIFKNAEDHMYSNKRFVCSAVRRKTIDLVMNSLYLKSGREQLHSIRVSKICEDIATVMGMGKNDVFQTRLAGLMHDIGKIEIDEKVLNKSEKLNGKEWEMMRRHPETGYQILNSVNDFAVIAEDVLEHQERWDGKGYPRGLKGEESSLHARIISIADAFDVMTSSETYGQAICEEDAIKEIKKCSGTQFDPTIAQIFIEKVLEKKWE